MTWEGRTTNAEYDAAIARLGHEVWEERKQLNTRRGNPSTVYIQAHWGSGCAYKTAKGGWRCEWSSGTTRPSGRTKFNVVTLRGSYESARKLLDLITMVPYRSKEDAVKLIAPYVRETNYYGKDIRREMIDFNMGAVPLHRQIAVRARIELDYWRLRLLDTLEAYRRFDDD